MHVRQWRRESGSDRDWRNPESKFTNWVGIKSMLIGTLVFGRGRVIEKFGEMNFDSERGTGGRSLIKLRSFDSI